MTCISGRGKVATGLETVIVTIDQKSVDALGRWSWPHTRIADLRVTRLPEDVEGVYALKKK